MSWKRPTNCDDNDVISTGNVPPRISVTTLGASEMNVVYVTEPADGGHFVAFVDVSDDDGDIADVTCTIRNQVSSDLFTLATR